MSLLSAYKTLHSGQMCTYFQLLRKKLLQTSIPQILTSERECRSNTGVLYLFSPIPHFLVGQLSISHQSIGL